jgi:RNA-directed DNA polymerase
MNELDQFVKHSLKVKRYARYTDDFIIVSSNKKYLEFLLLPIESFLRDRLALSLHPQKVSIRPYHQGVDFLGYLIFPHHILVRMNTKCRIFQKLDDRIALYKNGAIREESLHASLHSYLGVFSHADAHIVSEELKNRFWFRLSE